MSTVCFHLYPGDFSGGSTAGEMGGGVDGLRDDSVGRVESVGVRDESRSRSTTRSESSVESSSIDIARLNWIESSRR